MQNGNRRRVVVTGLGIVSSIGNNFEDVADALTSGRSGITFSEQFAEQGFRSQVWAMPQGEPEKGIDRKLLRFMSQGIAWNYLAMQQAIGMAKLTVDEVSNYRTGLIMGSGGPSTKAIVRAADTNRAKKGTKHIGPFEVPKTMSSGPAANMSVAFKTKGIGYSITSACATSAHCIGEAAWLILNGRQDRVFAGGCEELDWTLANGFDAMQAMSSACNQRPELASRAYDRDRDGFVIAGGAGVLVLEELEVAKRRNVPIIAELVGYGATSDGADMVQPSGEGAVRCMRMALEGFDGRGVGKVDYLNPHGTSTPIGDVKEMEAVREVFGDPDDAPPISSTKSLTGHSLGAIGVQESIFSLLMLQGDFIAGSANIENLDPAFLDMPIVQRTTKANLDVVMSNSFGFGGTNATLVFRRYAG